MHPPTPQYLSAVTALVMLGSTFNVSAPTAADLPTPVLATHSQDARPITADALAARINPDAFSKAVLVEINKARATKHKCGNRVYPAAKPLTRNSKLAAVAVAHSKDMSRRDYVAHNNKSGRTPFDRMRAAGYRYKYAGEDLAAGYDNPANVVTAWLDSPAHCKILMSDRYTEVGVGFYQGSGYYWYYTTADFGRQAKKKH